MAVTTAERPKGKSLKPLRALPALLAPHAHVLAGALAALFIAAAAQLALPIALRFLIDEGLVVRDTATIDRYFIAFIAAAAAFGVFAALRYYLITWLGERVVADLRSQVYSHVIRMDPTFFEVTRTGEVLSRLTADTTLVQSIAGVGISITLRSAVTLAGSLVMLILTSPLLTAMIVLLMPVVVAPLIVLGRRVRTLSRDSQDRIADASALAGETINAVQTVQAFTLENLQTRRFTDAVEHSFAVAIRRIRVRALLTAIATMLVFGAITLVLWIGAHQVVSGRISFGELSQFLLYAGYLGISAASLSEMWSEVQRAAGAMERLVELKDARPMIRTPPNPRPLPSPGRGRIDFEHVSFRYPSRPESAALDDFTLSVAPGETVAFVGPSGAGKSTVFQLLLRYYDPSAGRILIDGVDIAEASPEDVRQRIGLVPQDTVLFGATARENIRYGRPDASDREIEAAARAAAADDFIRALPQGYDTFLGERGTRLSGGQRQRIAIARALLKDPPILVLDEATSALDTRSERAIQGALERLAKRRTTLTIAHRLSTVVGADEILVLEAGRIVERGRHTELLERDGLYAQMWALQEQERALRRSERRAGMRALNLAPLISGAIEAVRGDLDAKGIELYTTIGLDVGLVTGDPSALQDVVWGLLGRAVQVSEPGARVEVSLERAGNEVLLKVVDTSAAPQAPEPPLIPPENARFDLRTLAAIIEEHQGRLTVAHDGGATITASLPVRAVAPTARDERATRDAAPRAADVSLAGRHLLVVDDDEDARETLGALLRTRDAEIDSVADARTALAYLRDRTRDAWPDMIICDIGLPDEDGYTLLRRVRNLEAEQHLPLARRMPAVALTGFARSEDRVHALVAGFQAHLAKPAQPAELFATIGRLLGGGVWAARRGEG